MFLMPKTKEQIARYNKEYFAPPKSLLSFLEVDHCHQTNQVRGLLCGPCNRALGLLKDNIGNLERAIAYLDAV